MDTIKTINYNLLTKKILSKINLKGFCDDEETRTPTRLL